MKLLSSMFRNSLLVLAVIFLLGAPQAAAQGQADNKAPVAQTPAVPARITQAIDETQLVRLKGNVHPLARPEFDKGAVSSGMPLQRMLLMLKRSSEQQAALSQLMVDQYNTNSLNYHKWLTPEQFGAQFGPADADIQAVTSWLQSHGFQVAKVSKGKLAIEFSGTASQLKQAFHTEIHKFFVNGEQHFANASDPQIPAALMPVVQGLAPLHNFHPKPMHRVIGEFTKLTATGEVKPAHPEVTTISGCGTGGAQPCYALGPTDFATIYNVLPLWQAGPPAIDGTGVSIAVAGVSNIHMQDITDFRALFALPATVGTAMSPPAVVVIDGSDPGVISLSETEALLDTEWSGAVAKGAQIHLVIAADTDIATGLILAIFNVIDNNSDPILSVSFGNCEAVLGTQGNNAFLGMWEQAAAQGITVTVSTGDNGAAGCDDQNASPPSPATGGLQVSGFASTPFNVAVGGTDFNDNTTQALYFNSASDATTLVSAKGYIPEATWNESCTNTIFGNSLESDCNSAAAANAAAVITVGGSGGKSTVYAKPAFQSFAGLTGMPADGARDLPDVSLFASTGAAGTRPNRTPLSDSFYVLCEADQVSPPSCQKGGAFNVLGIGGTSASAPAFAGIMALVNQMHGRQGNANFVIYKLAQMQFQAGTMCASAGPPNGLCTFNDITTGTIAMPCAKASTNCTPTGADTVGVLPGFSAATGYDLATGLGSVNANNLVTNWTTAVNAFTPTTTTLSLNPTTGITASTAVTVNITVARNGGAGTPTGDVSLTSNAQTGDGVDGFTLNSSGQVSATTTQLTGGMYQVTARYSGDGTFAPSVSTPVTVTVGKANSTTTGGVFVSTGGGNFAAFTSGNAPVTLYLQASVKQATTVMNNGPLSPTGTVTFSDTFNGSTTVVASNVPINQAAEAFSTGISTFGAGKHSITAQYNGDPSFNTSASSAVAFTINGAGGTATSTALTSSSTNLPAGGGSVTLTATVTGMGNGASPTGTVQFMNGTTALSSAQMCTAVAGAASPTCKAMLTTNLSFLVPPAGPNRIPRLHIPPVLVVVFALLILVLLSVKRVPAPYRRAYACVGLLLLVGLVAGFAGCGGGYGGGGNLHYDNITAVYSGDNTYAGSTSTALQITIQ